jgi:hypothetical protein
MDTVDTDVSQENAASIFKAEVFLSAVATISKVFPLRCQTSLQTFLELVRQLHELDAHDIVTWV